MSPKRTLATWNLENFFRPGPSASHADRATYDAKLGLLARVIQGIDPDVVALQEVGGDDALADLQRACGLMFDHRLRGVPDGRGIAVAFLSKLALNSASDIVQFPPEVLSLGTRDGKPLTRMGRGALHVRVTKAGFHADVIAVHLKSKLLTFAHPNGGSSFVPPDESARVRTAALALARRNAEAATVRLAGNRIIVGNARRALAIVGDFNDVPSAATTQLFQGPDGNELDTGGFERPDQGDDARLWNLAELIPKDHRFSRIHRGQGELIDHIFCSEEFFPLTGAGTRRLPVSTDAIVTDLRSIGDDPASRKHEPWPDHAPVFAVFDC